MLSSLGFADTSTRHPQEKGVTTVPVLQVQYIKLKYLVVVKQSYIKKKLSTKYGETMHCLYAKVNRINLIDFAKKCAIQMKLIYKKKFETD